MLSYVMLYYVMYQFYHVTCFLFGVVHLNG